MQRPIVPASQRYCLLFSLILLSLSCLDETRAIRHFTEVHVSDSEPPLYDREVLYTVADAPGFGSNRSEIEIDIDFGRKPAFGLSVIVYYYEQLLEVAEITSDGQIANFCCNENTYYRGCEMGGPIARNQTGVRVYIDSYAAPDSGTAFKRKYIPIESGPYGIVVANCDPTLGPVTINAYVIAENPYGFLPGDIYPLYPFYGSIAAAYLIVAAFWAYFSYQHMDNLLMLQHCISVVIFLNMLESATWYGNYLTWNLHGSIVGMGYVGGIFMSTLKRTLCRLLLLLAAMGFSVTKANLGATQYRVMVLAGVYFICSAIQMSLEMARRASSGTNVAVTNAEGVFGIPAAILEFVFWWWTFLSLLATLSQVRLRGQVQKEALYRKFLYCLVFAALTSFAVMMLQLFFIQNGDEYWPILWIFDAGFWEALNFCVLIYLAWLWLPSADNSAYAYGELHDQELAVVPSTIAADQVILRREPRERVSGPAAAASPVSPLEKDELIEALTNLAMDEEEKQAMENPKNAKIE